MQFWIIAFIVVVLDQLTKLIFLSTGDIKLLPFFSIELVGNTGAGFGILQGRTIILTIISVLVIAFIIYLEKSVPENTTEKISLALLLGGTAGNLIDRIFRGEIVDFLHFQYGWFNYPAFNLADSAIVIGMIVLIIVMIRKRKHHS